MTPDTNQNVGFKPIVINVVIACIIIVIVIELFFNNVKPTLPLIEPKIPQAQEIAQKNEDLNKDIRQGSLTDLKERALDMSIAQTERASANGRIVRCPMYVMPDFVPVTLLPSKDVLAKANKDQLIFILYQNIKGHQERTLMNRKRLYDTYSDYINECK